MFICGCSGESSLNDVERANQNEMLSMLQAQIRQLVEIEQFEAALFQISHTEAIIKNLPRKSKEVIAYRNGELARYKALCQRKLNHK